MSYELVGPERLAELSGPQAQPLQLSLDLLEPGPAEAGATQAVAQEPSVLAGASSGLPTNMAEVLARVEASPDRTRKRVEMASALRRIGDVLRRPLEDIPADPQELRSLLAGATPASVGMTKERWSRVRSLLGAALRETGCDLEPGHAVGGRSAAWQAFLGALPQKKLRVGISRFASHCTRLGIEPWEVTPATFEAFSQALSCRSLHQRPEAACRATIRYWNRAQAAVDGWPPIKIEIERHQRFYALEWEAFPPTFVADVEACLSRTGSTNAFSEDYSKGVRPSTIAQWRKQIRQVASLLVASGFPIGKLVSLAVLVEPDNAIAALQHQKTRTGDRIGVSLGHMAWLLAGIAHRWVKDPAAAKRLASIAKILSEKPKGMTPRNRERLRQFDLPENLYALLELPDSVFAQAKREKLSTPEEARRVMLALAVEILTVVPMRVSNLCGLDLDRHLVVIGRGAQRVRHVVIPAEEMKTGEAFEVALPERTAALIDVFVSRYRSRIWKTSSPYLFVSSRGAKREKTSFTQQISKFIYRETGLVMHVHLFRHLAGKLHLDRNPSDLESVRLMLGHRSSATTSRHYAENKSRQAFQSYDETLARLRTKAKPSPRPKKGTRRENP